MGIIDLGSNTVRLVLLEVGADGSFRLLDNIKEVARLAEGMSTGKVLSPQAVARTVEIVGLFNRLCQAYQVNTVLPVATAAVRMAVNAGEFLANLKRETGLAFRVLSGEEEARYVHLGVASTMELRDGIILDVGGGSAELILMQGRRYLASESLPLGAVTLSELFPASGQGKGETEELEAYIHRHLQSLSWLPERSGLEVIGLGGTVRTLAKIDRRRRSYELDLTHHYTLTADAVHSLYDLLRYTDGSGRREIPGLAKERADIIVGGVAVVDVLLRHLGSRRLVVSGSGLREGLFYSHLLRREEPVEDVLGHSVENLMKYYRVHEAHARHVARLAGLLFDQVGECGGARERELLTAAALLHDVGIAVSFYDHHKHSFYLITNARLNGLTHRELLLCALVAMGHNRLDQRILARYRSLLLPGDEELVKRLALLLKLAEELDRSESGVVRGLAARVDKERFVLQVAATNGAAALELKKARENAPRFKALFGRELIILGADDRWP